MAALSDLISSFRRDSLKPTTTRETSTLSIILGAEKVEDTIVRDSSSCNFVD